MLVRQMDRKPYYCFVLSKLLVFQYYHYFFCITAFSRHTKQSIKKVYADKGYAGLPNREFLAENKIADGIMRKNLTTATLTQ